MAIKTCHVCMKKDLERVGMAGQLVKVTRSYAENFLVPKGFASILHDEEVNTFKQKTVFLSAQKEVLATKTSMLAERIKSTVIVLAEKTHDENKLYGSIKEDEIVTALKAKGIAINKKQVEFNKSIKSLGEFKVVIRLSSSLQPELVVKVVSL